jgi:hypothetical protein
LSPSVPRLGLPTVATGRREGGNGDAWPEFPAEGVRRADD